MNRRSTKSARCTAIATLVACLAWWSAAAALAESGRPNVFLIVIDTLRADHLSCYGYGRETSPNIDRLAAQGVLYEQSISAASWTFPAHASLFTGLYPRDHDATSQTRTLASSFDTLAELLKQAGYRTAGFSNNVWTHDASGLKQGFEEFREMWHQQVVEDKGISFDDPAYDMGAALTTEEIFGWLDGGAGERPVFVFVNYFEPHLPYRPARPFDDAYLPAGADPRQVSKLRSFYSPREYAYILDIPWVKVGEKELEILTALYDGEIAYVDSIIGRLVDGLRSRGLDDTLLVITSDHGEHLGEHHMLDHKLSLYDPLLRVPLILWNPRRLPAGVRVESQVQAHDVFGTILDFAGIPRESAPRLPFANAGERHTFAELAYPRIFLDAIDRELPGLGSRSRRFARSLKAVRGPRYKLIEGSDGRVELFDVAADPGESRDLAAELPQVTAELKIVLEAFKNGSPPEPSPRPSPEP